MQENDGIPEDQEHHGGPGRGLGRSGTVTALTGSSVTIKTASGTTTYAVTPSSDIDKNGEAALSDLVVGDAVRFSAITSGTTQTIDKLHAGDEAKDRPEAPAGFAPGMSGSGTGATPGSFGGYDAGGAPTATA